MKKKKSDTVPAVNYTFFDRDLSWLSFNERVLSEAQQSAVPLMERIRFLSIYSSNLDEFYRVRMPAIKALNELEKDSEILSKVNERVLHQQKHFGGIIKNQILKELKQHNIHLVYNEAIPEAIIDSVAYHFIHSVAAYIQVVNVSKNAQFFPENNKLYLAVNTKRKDSEQQLYIVNVPSDAL